jgi:hypothetical protein
MLHCELVRLFFSMDGLMGLRFRDWSMISGLRKEKSSFFFYTLVCLVCTGHEGLFPLVISQTSLDEVSSK